LLAQVFDTTLGSFIAPNLLPNRPKIKEQNEWVKPPSNQNKWLKEDLDGLELRFKSLGWIDTVSAVETWPEGNGAIG
jgi:hypothetical protein